MHLSTPKETERKQVLWKQLNNSFVIYCRQMSMSERDTYRTFQRGVGYSIDGDWTWKGTETETFSRFFCVSTAATNFSDEFTKKVGNEWTRFEMYKIVCNMEHRENNLSVIFSFGIIFFRPIFYLELQTLNVRRKSEWKITNHKGQKNSTARKIYVILNFFIVQNLYNHRMTRKKVKNKSAYKWNFTCWTSSLPLLSLASVCLAALSTHLCTTWILFFSRPIKTFCSFEFAFNWKKYRK